MINQSFDCCFNFKRKKKDIQDNKREYFCVMQYYIVVENHSRRTSGGDGFKSTMGMLRESWNQGTVIHSIWLGWIKVTSISWKGSLHFAIARWVVVLIQYWLKKWEWATGWWIPLMECTCTWFYWPCDRRRIDKDPQLGKVQLWEVVCFEVSRIQLLWPFCSVS